MRGTPTAPATVMGRRLLWRRLQLAPQWLWLRRGRPWLPPPSHRRVVVAPLAVAATATPTVLILESNGALQKIPVSEIYEVNVRKFSFLKSSGLIAGTLLVVACVAVIGFVLVLLGV